MKTAYVLTFERGSYSDYGHTLIGVFSTPELAKAAAVCVDDDIIETSKHNPDYKAWKKWDDWAITKYGVVKELVNYCRYKKTLAEDAELVTDSYSDEFFSVTSYEIDKDI